jgi:hypothetical protein
VALGKKVELKIQCNKCKGAGKFGCGSCQGGRIGCSACGAKGKFHQTAKCGNCRGGGKLVCGTCKGAKH